MIPPGREAAPLRILVVNWQDRTNPQAGGAEAHLHETFGRLAARGHRVAALVSGFADAPRRETLDGIDVHRTGGRHTFSVAAPWYYRRRLADAPWDVLVEDLNKVPLFSPAWTGAPVVPLFHHLFGATAFQEANPLMALATWFLERPIPLAFRGLESVAVSESTRDDLVARGLDRSGITVIPNGIDLERYTPEPEGLRFERPTLLYLGRLKRYKGVDLILRALPAVAAAHPDVRLVVGGKGDHAAALRALAERLGVAERVEFAGFVSEEEKLRLFRKSWVHVLTSPKEGWGIANMEAAACGTPTVSSDAPGLRESVVDGTTGLLVPHGDVAALADALIRLVGDPGERDRMGEAARGFARTFSWDASADAMEAHLRRVVARSGGG